MVQTALAALSLLFLSCLVLSVAALSSWPSTLHWPPARLARRCSAKWLLVVIRHDAVAVSGCWL